MPQRFRVTITPRALADITEICSYIERDSPQNAAAVAQQLLNAIDSLQILPRRYSIHESRKDPTRSVHSMPISSFIIYYRVAEEPNEVQVLRVLHGHRRQPRRFR